MHAPFHIPISVRTARSFILVAAVLFGGSFASAQQDPMYTMYMWNTLSVNPAYAGSSDLLTITGLARQQWVGLDGAPSTQTLTLHSPLPQNALGVGLSVVHDEVGPINNTLLFADLAYRIHVTQNARLAFGLKAGVDLFHADLASVPGTDASDPLFQQNVSSSAKPNFGFGVYYWSAKGYLGISAPKLIQHDLLDVDNGTTTVNAITQKRHWFVIGGYVFTLSPAVKFRPSFLVKAVDGAPLSIDITANFLLAERLWLGIAYRNEDSISGIVAYNITEQFRAGYAYDFTLTALRSQQGGTHELMLQYDFRFNKEKTLSPRYF
ncbi:MAG: type IX secretion system membrane protein PorP/SprF [Flavobacteriales bacterium]